VDFGQLWKEGVGYTRHRTRQKEVIDAHPTNHDDTRPSPLRATVSQTCLPACSTVATRFDPCPRRWVLIQDPEGEFDTQAFLCTDLSVEPAQIISWFVRHLSDGGYLSGNAPAPGLREPEALVG
jgi:hypothetical protein